VFAGHDQLLDELQELLVALEPGQHLCIRVQQHQVDLVEDFGVVGVHNLEVVE